MKRMAMLFALMCTLVVLVAPVAMAQAVSETFDVSTTMYACSGEPVDLEGTVHYVTARYTDEGYFLHVNYDLQGAGRYSGIKYVGHDVENSFIDLTPGFTYMDNLHQRLIAQGSAPDLRLDLSMFYKLNDQGELVVYHYRAFFSCWE